MGYEVRPDYIPREAIRMVWKKRNKLNWHISSVVSRNDTGKLEVTSYAHLFDACTQDWFAIVSMLENLLVTVKAGRPIFFVAYLRWDEVGYYHNNFLLAALKDVGHRVGISLKTCLNHSVTRTSVIRFSVTVL